MAASILYLDKRRRKKDGEFPVKIVVTHRGRFMISTGISCLASEWVGRQIAKGKNSKAKNAAINNQKVAIDKMLLSLELEGKLNSITDTQLKNILTGKGSNTRTLKNTFADFIKTKEGNTKRLYLDTMAKISGDPLLDDITPTWLHDFYDSMNLAINTKAIHMRNIRAVINYAIDKDYTQNYPFRKFKIQKEKTRHRDLSVNELRRVRDYKGKWEPFADCFMLSFYLIGMNLKDLLHTRKTSVKGGRLEYTRMKTGKHYSINIEPEAQSIIAKYADPDDDLLVSFLHMYKDYEGFKRGINYALKIMADEAGIICSDLTTYHARHTWASIASSIDVTKDVISEALGHEYGSKVTSVYVNFNQKKVDQANRKVLDHIL